MTATILPPHRSWTGLSAPALAAVAADPRAVAVLPVGAVEQHGPHLPLGTDALIAEALAAGAAARAPDGDPILVLPVQAVGFSIEHGAFSGTLSHDAEPLLAQWRGIAEGVQAAGLRRLVIVNAHGGQPQIADLLIRELRMRYAMLAVNATWFRFAEYQDIFGADERRRGKHGGAAETSLMLHLYPHLVDMAAARDFPSDETRLTVADGLFGPQGAANWGWAMQDLNPAGVVGDAAAATAEAGARLFDRLCGRLGQILSEAAAFDLAQFDPRP